MRGLNKEEIEYLKENDPVSLARIPIIRPSYDEVSKLYDTNIIYENIGNEEESIKYWEKENALIVRERLNPEKRSMSVVFCNGEFAPMFMITAEFDDAKGFTYDEMKLKGAKMPITIRDLSKISLTSSSIFAFVYLNHPCQEPKVSQFGKNKGLCLYDDEILFLQTYESCGFEGTGGGLKDICIFNLKDDLTSKLNPPLKAKTLVPEAINNVFSNQGLLTVQSKESKHWGKYTDIINKCLTPVITPLSLDLNAKSDITIEGCLPGMAESHMENIKIFTDRKQKEPVSYEVWRQKEIPWRVEDLTDPINQMMTYRDIRKEYRDYRIQNIKNEDEWHKVDVIPVNLFDYEIINKNSDFSFENSEDINKNIEI